MKDRLLLSIDAVGKADTQEGFFLTGVCQRPRFSLMRMVFSALLDAFKVAKGRTSHGGRSQTEFDQLLQAIRERGYGMYPPRNWLESKVTRI